MINARELRRTARARLADAEALLKSRRYDAAVYICGYAVEIALKARVCRTLGWAEYPSTSKDFHGYASFRTHDLDVLLHLSGREAGVKRKAFADWSIVVDKWHVESRYGPTGLTTEQDAEDMISSARTVIGVLA